MSSTLIFILLFWVLVLIKYIYTFYAFKCILTVSPSLAIKKCFSRMYFSFLAFISFQLAFSISPRSLLEVWRPKLHHFFTRFTTLDQKENWCQESTLNFLMSLVTADFSCWGYATVSLWGCHRWASFPRLSAAFSLAISGLSKNRFRFSTFSFLFFFYNFIEVLPSYINFCSKKAFSKWVYLDIQYSVFK